MRLSSYKVKFSLPDWEGFLLGEGMTVAVGDKTQLIALNTTPQAFKVNTPCAVVVVYENNQAGTQDYTYSRPFSSSQAVTRPAGAKTRFLPPDGRKYFSPGDTFAWLATAASTITMVQAEDEAA